MRAGSRLFTVLFAAVILGPVAFMQEKGGQEPFGPYEVVANWP